MFESTLHRHTEACRAPLEELFTRLEPGARASNFAYYWDRGADGRVFVKLNGMYALVGCSELRIPVFLSKMPEGLEVPVGA